MMTLVPKNQLMSYPCSTSSLSSSQHTTLLLQDVDVAVAVSFDDNIGVDIVVIGVDVICVLAAPQPCI